MSITYQECTHNCSNYGRPELCSKGDGIYYSTKGRTYIINSKCVKEKCTVKETFEEYYNNL
jgi:hypothetical protein